MGDVAWFLGCSYIWQCNNDNKPQSPSHRPPKSKVCSRNLRCPNAMPTTAPIAPAW
jgi:hypothetical protein